MRLEYPRRCFATGTKQDIPYAACFPRAARTYIAIGEMVTVAQKEVLSVATRRPDHKIAIPESGDHSYLNVRPYKRQAVGRIFCVVISERVSLRGA